LPREERVLACVLLSFSAEGNAFSFFALSYGGHFSEVTMPFRSKPPKAALRGKKSAETSKMEVMHQ